MMTHNPVGWFEIPVTDMDRAVSFYEAVFQISLERHEMGELDMAWFPAFHDGIGAMGSLVKHKDFYFPSDTQGPLLYFTAFSGDLANELQRVESAGGRILVPKRQISPDHGYMGLFLDTEGNRLALHSRE